MSPILRCPTCERELEVSLEPGVVRVKLKGKPPEECCQRAATGDHKLMGIFLTEP